MIVYLDTSAIVKLYVHEEGSAAVRQLVDEAEAAATSRVAFAEVRAALAQALRLGRIAEQTQAQAVAAFRSDWEALAIVAVTQSVVELAADQADRHPLRGLDSVHLASALLLGQRLGEPIHFLAWDRRLNAAARVSGLTVPVDVPTP